MEYLEIQTLDSGCAGAPASCMECGACAINCPVEAISVRPGVGCAAAIVADWFGRLRKSEKGRQPGCC